MMRPRYRDTELLVPRSCETRAALLRTPARLSIDPALLIILMSDRRHSITADPPESSPADVFLAAGHRVISFDLPQHGDQVNAYGEGLQGMATAVANGVDVFAELLGTGRAVVEYCLAQNITRPGRIVIAGISRGGLCAVHLLAAIPHIVAGALFAPVTYLPALAEFRALADSPIVRRANALSLVPRLAQRPIFLTISADDPRVGTAHCRQFSEALRVAQPDSLQIALHITVGDTHALPDDAYLRGGEWLLAAL
jgi:dienelactone hydrolase